MTKDIRQWPLTGKFSSMDIEGDGHADNRPIEIGIIDYDGGQVVGSRYWLINPERKIQDYVRKYVHGITDRMVKNCPTFADIEHEFRAAMQGITLVGHGLKNDFKILRSVMATPELLPDKIVDTSTLAKLVLNRPQKISLEKACIALGIRVPDEFRCPRPGFHGATEDAYATGQLLLELPKLIPDEPSVVKQISNNVLVNVDKAKRELASKMDNAVDPSYGHTP